MNTKHLGFALTIGAIALFVPGILLPMFSLSMDMNIALPGAGFNSTMLDKELSIVDTVRELWQQNRHVVAILIFAFSVLVPVLKTSLLSLVYFVSDSQKQLVISRFVAQIGKWSMADVFVVAIFLAVLSTQHTDSVEQHSVTFFGMKVGFELSSQMLSDVGQGFYYFTGYCIVSMVGAQLTFGAIEKQKTVH